MNGRPELWLRPWAPYRPERRVAAAGICDIGPLDAPLLALPAQGSAPTGDLHFERQFGTDPRLFTPALPRAPAAGATCAIGAERFTLRWPQAPEKPTVATMATDTGATEAQRAAMNRLERIVARIFDVEQALSDPIRLWDKVSALWRDATEDAKPERDIIVRHARDLGPVIDTLAERLRRILRRTRGLLPVARVTEMDRASMLWLARQPGETLAERAGGRQRLLAPQREESFDTLENRVLRSYAELAASVARAYCQRNAHARATLTHGRVLRFAQRMAALAADLAGRGVRRAAPDAQPNYVLQHDADYARVWAGHQELLRREKDHEELWKWQARTWAEFCAVALVVALRRAEGAETIAAAPLRFREDAAAGQWLAHDNPLAVFHLPARGLIVEVQSRASMGERLSRLAAPLWLRVADFSNGFARRVAVWPLHSFATAPSPAEAEAEAAEVAGALAAFARTAPGEPVAGGIVIRPSDDGHVAARTGLGRVSALVTTLAPTGQGLDAGLAGIEAFCAGIFAAEPA